jgi:hypothetical protein
MQQPVTAAPVQTGDPEAFTYSPSVVDMKRPDVPITFGGGDPTLPSTTFAAAPTIPAPIDLPSTTFAAAPTIPAPIDFYGIGQQGEFAGMTPPVIPSVVSPPQASPQRQSAKEYSDALRSQGIIPSIADMQAAGYTDTEISSIGPASSPNALKVTIDKPTQTEDVFGIGKQGEFTMPTPVTPMAAGQQGAISATIPTGLAVDPRKPITTTGGAQATVFQLYFKKNKPQKLKQKENKNYKNLKIGLKHKKNYDYKNNKSLLHLYKNNKRLLQQNCLQLKKLPI